LEKITSKNNEKIKLARLLSNSKKYRDEHGLFLLESPKVIKSFPHLIKYLFLSSEIQEAAAVTCYQVDKSILKSVAGMASSPGILAVAKKPVANKSDLPNRGTVVLLDDIQDPGNVGAIIRTAVAFGCKAILYTKGTADPFSPKVVRASAGTILQVPLIKIDENISFLQEAGYTIVCAVSDGGADINELSSLNRDKVALVFSNEGSGSNSKLLDYADNKVTILHDKKVESLNVGVAAGIIMKYLY